MARPARHRRQPLTTQRPHPTAALTPAALALLATDALAIEAYSFTASHSPLTIHGAAPSEFFGTQSVDALIAALERAQLRSWNESEIRANGARFSAERFREGITRQVMQLYPSVEEPVVSVGALD